MSEETPKGSLLDSLQANPKFQKIPQRLQKWCIDSNINDAQSLVDYLCLQAQDILSKGAKQAAFYVLELAEELAKKSGNKDMSAQINAWLGLIESDDKELILETIEIMRDEIKSSPEFKAFEQAIFKK